MHLLQTANARTVEASEQADAAVAASQEAAAEAVAITVHNVRTLSEAVNGKETDEDGSGPPPKKACFPKTGPPVMSGATLHEVLVRVETGHVSVKSPCRSQQQLSPQGRGADPKSLQQSLQK